MGKFLQIRSNQEPGNRPIIPCPDFPQVGMHTAAKFGPAIMKHSHMPNLWSVTATLLVMTVADTDQDRQAFGIRITMAAGSSILTRYAGGNRLQTGSKETVPGRFSLI